MSVPLTQLPDTARVWVYGVDRPLDPPESATVRAELLAFVDQWTAHGAELLASVELVEDRFVIVAVDEASASASGCSIDALVRRLADLERRLACSLLDSTRIFYRSNAGPIATCDRAGFREAAAVGAVTETTPVFDLTVASLGEVRTGALELPLADSWHRRLVAEVLEAT